MSFTNWKGLLGPGALVLGLTVAVGACSSSSGGTGAPIADAASEVSHPVVMHKDASAVTGDDAGEASTATGSFDGTTGLPCVSNADCKGTAADSPGVNLCSAAGYFLNGPIDPTPVCLSPTPCDLGVDGNTVEFCDSADPTDPTSPGVCVSVGNGTTGLTGQCFPQCIIPSDGTPPVGCVGKDACNLFASGIDTAGQPLAIGFCVGGCAQDADCPTGSQCQKDQGVCLTTLKTATKTIGQVCSVNDVSGTRYGCNCFQNQTSGLGYCSQFCVTGATSTAPCPSGYTCDSQLPAQVMDATGTSVPGFTVQNDGLAGFCLQTCGVGDGGGDAGACGATSTCVTDDTAGTLCKP